MLVRPIPTEKAFRLESTHCYMFLVPNQASKQAVAAQIESQYDVTVTGVRVALRKGKPTRFSRGKHAYPGTTYLKDRKIAYVTLKAGDKIKVFDEEPTEAADDKSAEKKTKAAKEGAK